MTVCQRAATCRTVRTLALLALCGIVAACSVTGNRSTSSRTTAPQSTTQGSTTPGSTTPAGNANRSTLQWKKCDQQFQCATLPVPVDSARPDGEKITLAIARRPAGKPSERIGSIMVNPGGPGASAIELIEQVPFPKQLMERFDIVGFDPRGVGRSDPLECHSKLQQMYDTDPTIDMPAEQVRYLAVSRSYVDECRTKYANLLPHMGTRDVARDMDRVRQALGDDKLTYVGYSYGTSIGQQYADLFPTKIRAMVLDGVVDPSLTGLAGADLQAKGFESALQSYVTDCRATHCALGADPGATVDQVIASAEIEPIPSAKADRPATPGVVELGISQALYAKQLWPELTDALQKAAGGDGSGLVDLADQYLRREANGDYPNGSEVYFAVACLDSDWPRDPLAIFAAAKATGRKYPRLGEGLVNDYVRCALWPTPPQPLSGVTAPGSPPIVVISTTGDPATPYESGVAVAKRLSRGILVTNVGEGHTIFAQGKQCIDTAVTAYLADLVVPTAGLRCP